MSKSRSSIAFAINGLCVAACAAVLLVGAAAGYALQTLRVGGPVYSEIIYGKDLIADVLPPPAFVVEAFLVVNQVQGGVTAPGEARKELTRLKSDYDARLKYWAEAPIDADIKDELVGESDRLARNFWKTVESQFLPAAEAGDTAMMNQAYQAAALEFSAHKAVIGSVVEKANAENARIEADSHRQLTMMAAGLIALILLAMAGALVIGRWVANRVVVPVKALSDYMARLVVGDYSKDVPFAGRRDEMGDMAGSVATFRTAAMDRQQARLELEAERKLTEEERLQRDIDRRTEERARALVIERLAESLGSLAAGDLRVSISQAFPPEYEALRRDFNGAVERLSETLSVIASHTNSLQTGSDEISGAADDLSRRTEQQAASLEQTAAALEEITVTVRQTANGAKDVAQAVSDARQEARTSGEVVGEAVSAMGDIEQSSAKISQIIGVIDEIAFQTNLLALNAGVEAARAGEAGRGFAVVAQEVRALAQRSADAAKQIKGLISASSQQVGIGVKLVAQTGEALQRIIAGVGRIDSLTVSIAASAEEQSAGLAEVNTAVGQMEQMTQQNAAMVEQTTAATHSLRSESSELARRVGMFKLPETHLHHARAA